jgi:hypothetical protein
MDALLWGVGALVVLMAMKKPEDGKRDGGGMPPPSPPPMVQAPPSFGQVASDVAGAISDLAKIFGEK